MRGAALLEDGDLAQEADVVARVVLQQLLHRHRLHVVPGRAEHLRGGVRLLYMELLCQLRNVRYNFCFYNMSWLYII